MLAKKPENLAWGKAAGSVVTYITAYGAWTDSAKGGMQKGDAVLVIGASGGCGLAAVQLAKGLGAAEIVGLCSASNHALVLANGATRCIDYTDPAAYAAMLENDRFDVIYDTATAASPGTNYWPDGRKLLKKEKRCRHVSSSCTYGQLFSTLFGISGRQKAVFMSFTQVGQDLAEITRILGGTIDTQVDMVVPLSAQGLSEGLDRLRSRRARGKVVFSMKEQASATPVETVSSQ